MIDRSRSDQVAPHIYEERIVILVVAYQIYRPQDVITLWLQQNVYESGLAKLNTKMISWP